MDVVDTPPHVRRRVASVFAAMSGAQRLLLAIEMADEAREIALAGIRSRNSELDEDQVSVEWIRLLHGDEVADFRAQYNSIS